jgi:hydrogenase nickel incorporation protein HypA/HybF
MHEMSIVEALLDQVQEEVDRAGCRGRVTKLDLAVGRLSGVCADSLRFAFELLAPGTVAEGAAIDIQEPPAECVCRDCGRRQPIEDLVIECPACGSGQIALVGGRELVLLTIDVEEQEST